MNWSFAKNISIVCLIVLNILLGGLVYFTSTKYTLTSVQERALNNYLSQSNVTLNGKPVKNFAPMCALTITPYPFGTDEVRKLFFPDSSEASGITVSLEDGAAVLHARGGQTCTIDGNTVYYENPENFMGPAIENTEAEKTAKAFMAQAPNLFKGFALDKTYTQDGTTILEYRSKYQSSILYANALLLAVNSNGIEQAEIQMNEINGTDGAAREILSPDAALYLFVQNANYILGDEPISLDSMDIVYTDAENGTAVPCYRFYLEGGGQPVLINAYTNEVLLPSAREGDLIQSLLRHFVVTENQPVSFFGLHPERIKRYGSVQFPVLII